MVMTNGGARADLVVDGREAITRLRSAVIGHSRLVKAERHLRDLHAENRTADEQRCILICGDTGSGKTSLLRRFSLPFQERVTPEADILPVLQVVCPAKCTIKSLAETMLVQLGDPRPGLGTVPSLTRRVLTLLEGRGVEIVLLDEFQQLVDHRTERVAVEVSDWVKSLLNGGPCPIALVGMPGAERVLDANPQLARRCMARVGLTEFDPGSEQDRLEFRNILGRLEKVLDLPQSSGLHRADLSLRIQVATGGLLGGVAALLSNALRLAEDRRMSCLDQLVLRDAHEQSRPLGRRHWQNPFDLDQPEPVVAGPELVNGQPNRETRLRKRKSSPAFAEEGV